MRNIRISIASLRNMSQGRDRQVSNADAASAAEEDACGAEPEQQDARTLVDRIRDDALEAIKPKRRSSTDEPLSPR
jgi:hypothetical protein